MRLLLLLCAFACLAQEITILPMWKSGDRFQLEKIRSRKESRWAAMVAFEQTPIYVDVLASSGEGHRVRWRYGKAQSSDPLAKTRELLTELVLDVQLGPKGEYQRLVNEQEVTATLVEMTKGLLERLPEEARGMAAVRQALSAPVLLTAVLDDVQTYFGIFGVQVKAEEKFRRKLRQPFVLQPGKLVEAEFSLELTAANAETAELKSSIVYDAKELTMLLAEVRDAKAPSTSLERFGEYSYDRRRGLLKRLLDIQLVRRDRGLEESHQREFLLR